MDDLVNSAWRYADALGKLVLTECHGFDEFLKEDLTGMDWFKFLTHHNISFDSVPLCTAVYRCNSNSAVIIYKG